MDVTKECSAEGCDATIKWDKWSKIHSGWFFQRDGSSWCPEHIPEWVEAWRGNSSERV